MALWSLVCIDGQQVVVLSKADKYGNVRSVDSPGSSNHTGSTQRRRAKKVETHDNSGKRERYFPDDDRFSIQDMVRCTLFSALRLNSTYDYAGTTLYVLALYVLALYVLALYVLALFIHMFYDLGML